MLDDPNIPVTLSFAQIHAKAEKQQQTIININSFNITKNFRNSQYTSKYIRRSRAHEQFLKFLEGVRSRMDPQGRHVNKKRLYLFDLWLWSKLPSRACHT
jgi:hypothetical protein